jgi:prophage regulatory protein
MADQTYPTRLIRRKEVEALTGLARSTIYERIKQGVFPAPVSLGAKAVAWVNTEIQEWIEAQVSHRRRT